MSEKGPKEHDPRWVAQVTDELVEGVKAKALEGKIPCPVLRKFAEDHGVAFNRAGAAADLAGVRPFHSATD